MPIMSGVKLWIFLKEVFGTLDSFPNGSDYKWSVFTYRLNKKGIFTDLTNIRMQFRQTDIRG